jgi:hypothetical protein
MMCSQHNLIYLSGYIASTEERRSAYNTSAANPTEKTPLQRPRCRWEDDGSKDIGWKVADWLHLAQDRKRTVVGSYEHSNEPSGFIKCWEFFEY